MRHPLEGPRLKVQRAETQIEALRAAQDEFLRLAEYALVVAEMNPKTGKRVYRIRASAVPSPDWGVWIGEIAHNLRSALDQLVWQLALLTTGTPAPKTQFPIFLIGKVKRRGRGQGLRPHFEREGRKMMRSISLEHLARIEQLQPYKRGGQGIANRLWRLTELNNADKHRLLQVVGVSAMSRTWGYWDGDTAIESVRWFPIRALENGTKFAEATVGVHVNRNVTPLIAFGKGCGAVENRPVIITLDRIAKHVSQIIEGFAPEFG